VNAPSAIPTTYKGIRFRSRAEACWAVFMDELGWVWEYEPIDLDGYIPDFLVMLQPTSRQLLLEVKGAVLGIHGLREHVGKIQNSSWAGDALIVGAMPCAIRGFYYILGKYARPQIIGGETGWDWQDSEACWCVNCGAVTANNPNGDYRCLFCQAADTCFGTGRAANLVAVAWANAKNRVQWRGAGE
jgi:hypothetical protein